MYQIDEGMVLLSQMMCESNPFSTADFCGKKSKQKFPRGLCLSLQLSLGGDSSCHRGRGLEC